MRVRIKSVETCIRYMEEGTRDTHAHFDDEIAQNTYRKFLRLPIGAEKEISGLIGNLQIRASDLEKHL